MGQWEFGATSAVLKVEARRTLDRLRVTGSYGDEQRALAATELDAIEATMAFQRLTDEVLELASRPMPTVVRSIDALHLASALIIRSEGGIDLTFATHDRQQGVAATALGLPVIGVTI